MCLYICFLCCQAVGICEENEDLLYSRSQSWRSCSLALPAGPSPPRQVEAHWMDNQHCPHHPHVEVAGVAVVLVVLLGSRCYQMYSLSLSLMSGLEEPRQGFCYGDCFLFQASRGVKSPVWEGPRLFSTPDYLEIAPQSLSRFLQGDRLEDLKKMRLLG